MRRNILLIVLEVNELVDEDSSFRRKLLVAIYPEGMDEQSEGIHMKRAVCI